MAVAGEESIYEDARRTLQSQCCDFDFGNEELVLQGLVKVCISMTAPQLQQLFRKVGIVPTKEVDAESWHMLCEHAPSVKVVRADEGRQGEGLKG